jgi:hypothetical protein
MPAGTEQFKVKGKRHGVVIGLLDIEHPVTDESQQSVLGTFMSGVNPFALADDEYSLVPVESPQQPLIESLRFSLTAGVDAHLIHDKDGNLIDIMAITIGEGGYLRLDEDEYDNVLTEFGDKVELIMDLLGEIDGLSSTS